jgi:glutamyl endopeptidase
MNKRSTEAAPAQRPEGKSYGYQRPQETVADTSSLATHKKRIVDAFDDFLDVLANRAGAPTGSGTSGASGVNGGAGGAGTAGGTGSATTPASGAGGSGSSGAGLGYLTPTGATGGKPAGSASGTGSSGTGAGSGTYPAVGERPLGEAGKGFDATESTMSIMAQREAFRMDRAREAQRRTRSRSESAGGSKGASSGATAVLTLSTNKHLSDSNRASLTESREFPPMFGSTGKPTAPTMEKMAAPTKRPETVPAGGTVNLGRPIDAYFGSFGTAIERAAARAKVQPTILESIIGDDDRVRVTNNALYPWRCICSLLITANTGAQYIGTGWLVSPRLVLTAGHCVYMADENGWASQIEVIPGRNAGERPFGSAISRDLRSVSGWTQDNDSNCDYGAIILPPDKRYGEQLGWFGYATRDDDYLKSITVNLAGYPGDGGKVGQAVDGSQWYNFRAIKEVMDRQVSYEIDTYGGQSGAPVWEMTSNGSRYGVGIHTWGTSVVNGATRITREVFDNIVLWAGQAP